MSDEINNNDNSNLFNEIKNSNQILGKNQSLNNDINSISESVSKNIQQNQKNSNLIKNETEDQKNNDSIIKENNNSVINGLKNKEKTSNNLFISIIFKIQLYLNFYV